MFRFRRLGEKRREFESLRFAAGERVGRLAESQIAEADGAERGEPLHDGALVDEKLHRFIDGHRQDLPDVSSFVLHLHDLFAEAAAVAFFADHFDVGEELHVDGLRAGAFAGVAASARGVEREHAGRDAVELRGRRLRHQLADLVPRFDVGRRIRSRGATDRRLIDELHVVDVVRPFELRLPDVESRRAAKIALIAIEEAIANERRLAGAGDPGDRH